MVFFKRSPIVDDLLKEARKKFDLNLEKIETVKQKLRENEVKIENIAQEIHNNGVKLENLVQELKKTTEDIVTTQFTTVNLLKYINQK